MKKISKIFLTLLLFFIIDNVNALENNAYFINKNGIEISNEQYNKLLYFEYTENEIDSMSLETFNFINGINFDNKLKSEVYYEDIYIYTILNNQETT